MYIYIYIYIQAEIEAQRARADSLERERDAVAHQLAELKEKLAKALADIEELKGTLEVMVPRYE